MSNYSDDDKCAAIGSLIDLVRGGEFAAWIEKDDPSMPLAARREYVEAGKLIDRLLLQSKTVRSVESGGIVDDRPAYIGGDSNDIRVQPSGLRDGWIYVMAYHATMNPAAARELALRLSRAAYLVDGKYAVSDEADDLRKAMALHAKTCEAEVARRIADAVSVSISGVMAMIRLPGTFVVSACAQCGVRPAVCVGCYEGEGDVQLPACNECCGHGFEDGKCRPLDARDWSSVGVSAPADDYLRSLPDASVDSDTGPSSAFMTWRQVCRRLVHLALVTDGSAFDAEAVMRLQIGDDLYCGGIRSLNVDCGCTDDPALVIDGDDDGAKDDADAIDQGDDFHASKDQVSGQS